MQFAEICPEFQYIYCSKIKDTFGTTEINCLIRNGKSGRRSTNSTIDVDDKPREFITLILTMIDNLYGRDLEFVQGHKHVKNRTFSDSWNVII